MLKIEAAITDLKSSLKNMTDLTLDMVGLIRDALVKGQVESLDSVFQKDRLLDEWEKVMDQKSLELLALINPLASDLRFAYAIIKLDVDLERIGDECKNLVYEIRKIKAPFPEELSKMADKTLGMVRQTIQSLRDSDSKMARQIILMDDEVDKLEFAILEKYSNDINAAFAARSLERIADHATNIAENVVYAVDGVDIRHENTLANRLHRPQD